MWKCSSNCCRSALGGLASPYLYPEVELIWASVCWTLSDSRGPGSRNGSLYIEELVISDFATYIAAPFGNVLVFVES